MDKMEALEVLAALGQSTRLDAYELLLRSGEDGLAAGEVAQRLAVPQNTMSTHLATLARAGLVRWERHSRNIIYRADGNRLLALTSFLREDCGLAPPNLTEASHEGHRS